MENPQTGIEQTGSTRTMKIVIIVVICMVVVAGLLSALFYTPNGECMDESVQDTEMSIDAPAADAPSEEAAPF